MFGSTPPWTLKFITVCFLAQDVDGVPPSLLSYFKASNDRAAKCEKFILKDAEGWTSCSNSELFLHLQQELLFCAGVSACVYFSSSSATNCTFFHDQVMLKLRRFPLLMALICDRPQPIKLHCDWRHNELAFGTWWWFNQTKWAGKIHVCIMASDTQLFCRKGNQL